MKKFFTVQGNEKSDIQIFIANTFIEKLKGLMGTSVLATHTGLLLWKCNSIHMCFMNYAIDVVYLDKDFTIVKLVRHLKPWRISMCSQATHTLELPVGIIDEYAWQVGMQFEYKKD